MTHSSKKFTDDKIAISIIIPAYNTELYVADCLESLLNQTLKNIEFIVINDGSNDQTGSIVEKYADRDSRIKYISAAHGGAAKAGQVGLDFAQGEFVSFIDSDDYVASEMFERLYCEAKNNDCDVVQCQFCIVEENLNYNNVTAQYIPLLKKNKYCLKKSGAENMLSPLGYAWRITRTRMIKEYNLRFIPEMKCAEDYPWHILPLILANKVSVIDYCGYFYRRQNNPHTLSTIKDKRLLNFKLAVSFIDEFVQKYHKEYYLPWILYTEVKVVSTLFLKMLPEELQPEFMEFFRERWAEKKRLGYFTPCRFWLDFRLQGIKYRLAAKIADFYRFRWTLSVIKNGFDPKVYEKLTGKADLVSSGGFIRHLLSFMRK